MEEVTETGQPKSDVQLLIERIQKIQQELPEHEAAMTEEEAAAEAGRCLRCDKFGYGIFKGGRQREW